MTVQTITSRRARSALEHVTLRQAATMTSVGLAVGFVFAFGLGQLMATALYGVVALRPLPFSVVGAGVAIVVLAAAYLPARRALRTDPAAVLRA